MAYVPPVINMQQMFRIAQRQQQLDAQRRRAEWETEQAQAKAEQSWLNKDGRKRRLHNAEGWILNHPSQVEEWVKLYWRYGLLYTLRAARHFFRISPGLS